MDGKPDMRRAGKTHQDLAQACREAASALETEDRIRFRVTGNGVVVFIDGQGVTVATLDGDTVVTADDLGFGWQPTRGREAGAAAAMTWRPACLPAWRPAGLGLAAARNAPGGPCRRLGGQPGRGCIRPGRHGPQRPGNRPPSPEPA